MKKELIFEPKYKIWDKLYKIDLFSWLIELSIEEIRFSSKEDFMPWVYDWSNIIPVICYVCNWMKYFIYENEINNISLNIYSTIQEAKYKLIWLYDERILRIDKDIRQLLWEKEKLESQKLIEINSIAD